MKRLITALGVLLSAGLAFMAVAASPGTVRSVYLMRDLGTFGGTESGAYGINDRGQVVVARGIGPTEAARVASARSLVWENGKVRWLGTLAGGTTIARAVNGRGQVAGLSVVRGLPHAFLWQNGKMRELGALGGNVAEQMGLALNDRAEVVGARVLKNGVPSASGAPRAFLWRRGRMLDLGTLGTKNRGSFAFGVNERSQVVGVSTGFGEAGGEGTFMHAFLWQKGTMRDIATTTGGLLFGTAFAINDTSQVVGICLPAHRGDGEAARPCLWQQGTITVLATLPGFPSSWPRAINDKGQIVGFVTSAQGTPRAVIWEKGKVTELGGGGSFATDVNERGQIVGEAIVNGNLHAVLWTRISS